jgi:hypothetical protein
MGYDLWVQQILLPIIRFAARRKVWTEQLGFLPTAKRANDQSSEITAGVDNRSGSVCAPRTFASTMNCLGTEIEPDCASHGLALSTLQRQLKGRPLFALDSYPYLARFQTSRAAPDPSDVVGVVHFSSSPETIKERF